MAVAEMVRNAINDSTDAQAPEMHMLPRSAGYDQKAGSTPATPVWRGKMAVSFRRVTAVKQWWGKFGRWLSTILSSTDLSVLF